MARALAALAGRDLVELALTPGTDTSDLLGGFEQLDPRRRLQVGPETLFRTKNWEKLWSPTPASKQEQPSVPSLLGSVAGENASSKARALQARSRARGAAMDRADRW